MNTEDTDDIKESNLHNLFHPFNLNILFLKLANLVIFIDNIAFQLRL